MKLDAVNLINRKRIIVIGDVMLDRYYRGEVSRISPEAPVPVLKKTQESCVLGGAANVAANIIAAGQEVCLLSVVGCDDAAAQLKKMCDDIGIETLLITSKMRQTTEKIRLLGNNNQQMLRFDIEDNKKIELEEANQLYVTLSEIIGTTDVIVISDYMKGVLSVDLTQKIIRLANDVGVPVIIDVKGDNAEKYNNAFLLKPNQKELQELTGEPVSCIEDVKLVSEHLRRKHNCTYILTTCGADGMVLVGEKMTFTVEAQTQEVFDVTGAGDTVIAYIATCMANCISIKECVEVANCAAGIQVSKVGTSTVSCEEIKRIVECGHDFKSTKIIKSSSINDLLEKHRNDKIVFTNGCFDILHIGHIRYLSEAAVLGDILIVGLNSDASVRRLKGVQRPINSQEDRAEILSALSFVDYIVIFDEDTPINLIKRINPDVLVKGGDYSVETIVGAKDVIDNGGQVVVIPFVDGKSTTNIINKVKES